MDFRTNGKSRKPSDNKLIQQRLKGYQPNFSLSFIISVLIFFGTCFIIIAITSYILASSVEEVSLRYDSSCSVGSNCTLALPVDVKLSSPVYVYYELHNFHQNHRYFVRSRSYPQLRGETDVDLDSCDPVTKVEDLYSSESVSGEQMDHHSAANPCGLAAKHFFNDTFWVFDANNQTISISDQDISWDSYLYERNNDWETSQWTDVEDERFSVWMVIELFPRFRKLWGIIEQDLQNDLYFLTVNFLFDMNPWNGESHLVLTNRSSLGGCNLLLSIAFFVGGTVCYAACVLFVLVSKYFKKTRNI